MPTVSFLMSNYKTPPAYLRRALDSMLEQTFTDFEAVVINDGIKDASYNMLLEYAARDSRIRLIENEVNLGLAASLNRGIEVCRGKYIARMDTDDICLPDRLEKQVEYMDSHPDIMFAGAWADSFDNDENEITVNWRPVMCSREEYRIRLFFSNDPLLLHPTVIFRKSFLQKNSLYYSEDPLYRYSEDYEMWTRCADYGAAAVIEQVLLKYRNAQNESRVTIRHKEGMTDCVMNIQKKLLARLHIDPAFYDYNIHYDLLNGRKPYDLRYKQWMDLILKQNRKYRVYGQKLLKRLFHERWYNIVYHGIAKKKTLKKRLRCFATLYPDGYFRLILDLIKRTVGKK